MQTNVKTLREQLAAMRARLGQPELSPVSRALPRLHRMLYAVKPGTYGPFSITHHDYGEGYCGAYMVEVKVNGVRIVSASYYKRIVSFVHWTKKLHCNLMQVLEQVIESQRREFEQKREQEQAARWRAEFRAEQQLEATLAQLQ